jgi:hypothetical protein
MLTTRTAVSTIEPRRFRQLFNACANGPKQFLAYRTMRFCSIFIEMAATVSAGIATTRRILGIARPSPACHLVRRVASNFENHAMKTCRRAWNIALRRNPSMVPTLNPFAQMGLQSYNRETPTATYGELESFRLKAQELGYGSLATAALIGWEWWQREEAIFGVFDVTHYRPKDHPNSVRVVHPKTNEESWVPLFDEAGFPLYPELMAELEAIRRDRIGGLMLCRDWGSRLPWPTWPRPGLIDLTHMSRKVKEIIRAAGLRDELTFTSFRHGGFTEAGDAELTDAQIRAQGRHKSNKVLPKYVKRTMRQVADGAKRRRAVRTDSGHLSE